MIRLKDMIGRLRGAIERVLPDGCPFVIGGGLIRDALYGGRPNDIDIWLPSNIHVPDVDAFCAHMVNSGYGPRQGFQGQVIFRGPGSAARDVGTPWEAAEDTQGYGDVHNHWVVEIEPTAAHPEDPVPPPDHPRINIMRNMARWTGDAPSFFTEIMRNFDLDLCMYFVGIMPGQNTINTVIMPQHLLTNLRVSNQNNRVVHTRMNEVYWNQARLETTSVERILGRIRKMNEKYTVRITETIENIPVIRTEEIIAVPVLFRDLMIFFNGINGWGAAAVPKPANRVYQHIYDAALARAQGEFQVYRDRVITRGGIVDGLTPMNFLRLNYN